MRASVILLAYSNYSSEDAPYRIGILAIIALAGCGLYLFLRWLLEGPALPDPWDDQIAAGMEKDDATPLCCCCLEPHGPFANFCPACGAPVGKYTNWLPYP